jgi:hypothetical protein
MSSGEQRADTTSVGAEAVSEVRAPMQAAAWIVVSALVLLISPWISISGIDREAFPAVFGALDTSTALSAIGSSVGALVGVRLVLALFGKSESGVARTIACAVYLLLTMVQALTIALWMESLGYEMGYGDLVPEPGWKFRLTAVLACTTGAIILWWLADRIDATRAATGALAIALVAALPDLVTAATTFADGFAMGTQGPLAALEPLAVPVAMLALALVLALRAPSGWPVKLTGSLELRSAFDVLAAPAAIATLAGVSFGAVSAPELLRAGIILAATLALALLLRARTREVSPRRALWPLGLAISALALVLVPMGGSLATSGALAGAFEPGPLAGEARFTITLAAVDRFREGDAQAMVDHLRALDAAASIVSADEQRITLRVEGARDSESVLEALRPHTLALHLVQEALPSVPLPDGIRTDEGRPEGPCEVLARFAPSAGCHAALEPVLEGDEGVQGEPTDCRLHCLAPEAVVTGADVADASVIVDAPTNQPLVSATLTDAAAGRFADVTAASLGRQLAIVLDGEIVAAPVIRDAIPGGQIQITLGAGSYERKLQEATVLVDSLRAGRPGSEWTLESLEP